MYGQKNFVNSWKDIQEMHVLEKDMKRKLQHQEPDGELR